MAAIIRFFSKRFRRNTSAPAPSHVDEPISVNKSKKVKKSDIECKVAYLDGTEQTFYVSMWLDPTKEIKKQYKSWL
ncbi:unnamed protein product [Schistosoma margrebowiei]|uniref:Uncharacterized protein n=1 Tax=Schistosoma margrebowiei TaxID=48269 RepID=A0A183MV80_9TREM|nr:unnamed protein product [Schistosoma margrebowiei]